MAQVRLMSQAALALELRALLKRDDWVGLAALLDDCSRMVDAEGHEEVESARSEINDMHAEYVTRLEAAMGAGRAVRVAHGSWDRGQLSTTELLAATTALANFPAETAAGAALLAQAGFVASVRKELVGGCAATAATWQGLDALLQAAAAPLLQLEEVRVRRSRGRFYYSLLWSCLLRIYLLWQVRAAEQELGEFLENLEKAVRAALATGRSAKSVGKWSHEGIATAALTAALAELCAFPRTSDAGKALAAQAAFVIELREALLVSDWAKAATFAGLSDLLHGSDLALLEAAAERGGAEAWDATEVAAAREELEGKRAETEAVLKAAMDSGRSVRSATLKHGKVPVEALATCPLFTTTYYLLPTTYYPLTTDHLLLTSDLLLPTR